MSYKIVLFLAAWLAFASCAKEEEIPTPSTEEIAFSYEQGNYSGVTLPYRKAIINPRTGGQATLAIYLHGGTSKGSDNEAQLTEPGVDSIRDYLSDQGICSILLVPQCPTTRSWGGEMNAVLKALIDEYVANGQANSDRIYIFGGSMGGTGTWSMLSDYPGLFSAAMPVAGNPSGMNAENVSKTPLLTVMGTDDRIMDMDVVQDFITRLSSLGNENRLEIEAGWTHEDTCTKSYTSDRLEWVFSHQ